MNDIREFQLSAAEWANGQFGEQTAKQKIKKLHEEVSELHVEVYRDEDKFAIGEECADVIMVAMHIADIAGQDIYYHLMNKLKINRGRDWDNRRK